MLRTTWSDKGPKKSIAKNTWITHRFTDPKSDVEGVIDFPTPQAPSYVDVHAAIFWPLPKETIDPVTKKPVEPYVRPRGVWMRWVRVFPDGTTDQTCVVGPILVDIYARNFAAICGEMLKTSGGGETFRFQYQVTGGADRFTPGNIIGKVWERPA